MMADIVVDVHTKYDCLLVTVIVIHITIVIVIQVTMKLAVIFIPY
jgi:hypothetical protein